MNIDDYKTNDLLWDIKRIADALEKIAGLMRMNTNPHYPQQQYEPIPTQTTNNTPLPAHATPGSAGADLTAATNTPITIKPGHIHTIPTGISVAIPQGHAGLLCLRSSLGCAGLTIPNGLGIIDSDYRGEMKIILTSLTGEHTITPGQRIGQLIIVPTYPAHYVAADTLDDTTRGTGGFGSTGK